MPPYGRNGAPYPVNASADANEDTVEGFVTYNDTGMMALESVCNVMADDGNAYVLSDIAEFMSHPSQPNVCALRPTSYSDGLVSSDLSDCNVTSDLYDSAVVSKVAVQQLQGEERCTVHMKPGLSRDAYEAYETKIRNASVLRSNKYTNLVLAKNKAEGEIEQGQARIVELRRLIAEENAAYEVEFAVYNTMLAETQAIKQQVADIRKRAEDAHMLLTTTMSKELDIKSAIQTELDMTAKIRKKAKDDADAWATHVDDEKAARGAAKQAAIDAAARARAEAERLAAEAAAKAAAEAAAKAAAEAAARAAAEAAARAAAEAAARAAAEAAARAAAEAAVRAAKKCDVKMFQHTGFRGDMIPVLAEFGTSTGSFYGSDFDDQMSSFIVQPVGGAKCKLTLNDDYVQKVWDVVDGNRFEIGKLQDYDMNDRITTYQIDVS